MDPLHQKTESHGQRQCCTYATAQAFETLAASLQQQRVEAALRKLIV